jgi:predicted RNA-binding protein with PIN domain
MRWLVDGMNVIGARPNRWWEDRGRAIRQLAERLAEFASASGEPLTVVFDGRPRALQADVDVVFAPGGPNAADDVIFRIVSEDPLPSSLTVVTSDRALARRVEDLGAATTGAGAFLRRLDDT